MQIKVKKYIVAGYWMCVGKSYTDTIHVMQIQINKIKLQIISQVLITLEKESNWTESLIKSFIILVEIYDNQNSNWYNQNVLVLFHLQPEIVLSIFYVTRFSRDQ